jgi:hypothetical protein
MSGDGVARVLLVDGHGAHDVFELVSIADNVVRARSPFLYEIGEELRVRVEQGGKTTDSTARVRAHVGPADARVTELELAPA